MGRATGELRNEVWWGRPGPEVRDGRLTIAGRDAEAVARQHGTPLFAHDLTHVREQARALQTALAGAGLDVYEEEPMVKANPLSGMDNVVLGSHNANNGTGAVESVHENTLNNLARHLG